jgi:hypothetical protein
MHRISTLLSDFSKNFRHMCGDLIDSSALPIRRNSL